ncbi:polysaccharide biosynthesis tyrosine autokinase [Aestuariimicrobium sp. p3-SID1156]|uniref:polysaccharide biosynthesis tyrosine autokinase n=1 Tax=Aestuariimicrobium sp. p3-SID1156 TaxID=2916038 RepID=UPI00223AA18A|nr:polysaccharide biosynthesis tyrosine autokinase [Aestuariimicrobium sp. p3-SID1156]MCT1458270.1 polysaccharide biosynthesis tyrosine autokinase [Aestuariimicrobium sp. p3-SID1156]
MTLLDLVRLLRKNALVLLIGGLLGGGLAAAWTLTRPTVFRAQAVGLVVAGDSMSVANAAQSDLTAQARAGVYSSLITTRAVAVRVNQEMKTVGVAPGSYTASVRPGTGFIQISAAAPSARSAQATADAALKALTAEALRMETYAQAEQRGAAAKDLSKLTSIHILPYEQALAPAAPERPDLIRNLILGFLAGLLLGLTYALVKRQLDVRVRTKKDVEELTGRPVLGLIPDSKDFRKQRQGKGVMEVGGVAGEALRKLRTNLRFVHVDNPLTSIVVSSANPGEGKSTVASNIARLLALSGQQVTVVDCDLRRPTQSTIFGVDPGIGLSQVLVGDVNLEDAVVETGVSGLRLLPAGRIPPNPSELLGSQRMVDLLEELRRTQMVIIDAPPMLAVTDASVLSAVTDGVLLVAVGGRTEREHVRVCAEQLGMVGGALLGTVLNRLTRGSFGDASYGYGYGYGKGYGTKGGYYAAAAPEIGMVIPAAIAQRPSGRTDLAVDDEPSGGFTRVAARMSPRDADGRRQ